MFLLCHLIIEEQSKAPIFVLSELFLILNPLSFVTTAVEVIDANPVNVVALAPRAIPELPIVPFVLFARLLLAIEDAVVRTVPVSAYQSYGYICSRCRM